MSNLEESWDKLCNNIQHNAEQSGENNGYQPMSNEEQADNGDVSTDLEMKLPLKNQKDHNNTNSEDLSLDGPVQNVIQEDEIPTCEMGDDEVFYKGTGTKKKIRWRSTDVIVIYRQ